MAREKRQLTDLQSQAMKCLEAARRGGGTLSDEGTETAPSDKLTPTVG